jgi:hypothetical protein
MEKCGEKPSLGVLDPSWQLMRELANSLLGRTVIHDNARLGWEACFRLIITPTYAVAYCLMDTTAMSEVARTAEMASGNVK